jgi:predicted ATPase
VDFELPLAKLSCLIGLNGAGKSTVIQALDFNPELVEFLLDSLLEAPQQVLVTTHSPMILNWLDDDVARAGVQYLYRDAVG